MPIALGALAYASLRVGPWKIEKRDRLIRLRDLARVETAKGESRIDFALRFQRDHGDPTMPSTGIRTMTPAAPADARRDDFPAGRERRTVPSAP